MRGQTALLTFGIGPVHTFIAQARRVADVWAGSFLLSHLVSKAISELMRNRGGEMVFPAIDSPALIPHGLPNRFVCRVPAEQAEVSAKAMRDRIEEEWRDLVGKAVEVLARVGLTPSVDLWTAAPAPGVLRQTDGLLDISWSWVPEPEGRGGYAEAALAGARQFTASRLFRPFSPAAEHGEKCAICGQRSALPDGDRHRVEAAWREAEEIAKQERGSPVARFLRRDQGRLCLVCATKRLFPYFDPEARRRASFDAFDRFQPREGEPYLALVKLDGDRMGGILGLPASVIRDGDLEAFHREVSMALTGFASGLQSSDSPDLNLGALGSYKPKGIIAPQLVYAGGDDVLFVCDPRDALPLVALVRERYRAAFENARLLLAKADGREPLTVSAGVLFAHSGHPAGLLLRDLEELVEQGAKEQGGRDAVAIRLDKRSGPPTEVVLPWSSDNCPNGGWLAALDRLVLELRRGGLSSGQTFGLRLEERTLQDVFTTDDQWRRWLRRQHLKGLQELNDRGALRRAARGRTACAPTRCWPSALLRRPAKSPPPRSG